MERRLPSDERGKVYILSPSFQDVKTYMSEKKEALLAYLEQFLGDERKALLREILNKRTSHATVVLENIFHPYNASAILRTSECFGIQEVNVITEKYGEYQVNRDVVKGSAKWLDVVQHSSSQECIGKLKSRGYKIVATSPHATEQLEALPLEEKVAFVFGAEAEGVSKETMAVADYTISIPMYGFTESFNVSVGAAICLREFVERLRASSINWGLGEEEKGKIYLEWVRQSSKRIEDLEKFFEEKIWNNRK